MEGTFTLETRGKFRTSSQRRYVVVNLREGQATIYKRSDNLETARKERNAHPDGRDSYWYLVDTTNGELIDVAKRRCVNCGQPIKRDRQTARLVHVETDIRSCGATNDQVATPGGE